MEPFTMERLRKRPSSLRSNLLLALLLVVLLALLRVLGPQERLTATRLAGPSAGGPAPQPATDSPPVQSSDGPPALAPSAPSASVTRLRRFVLAGDTVNGEPLTDLALIERIERIAASVPANLLVGASRAPHVRYLSHASGAGDDAAVYYGMFREPAAALVFGCALDGSLESRCTPAPLVADAAAYEDPPGVSCRPMRLALGASIHEPDRCEAMD